MSPLTRAGAALALVASVATTASADAGALPPPPPPPPPPAPAPALPPRHDGPHAMPVNRTVERSHRKDIGMLGVAIGGGVVVTGLVFGLLARSRWNEAQDVCGGTTCRNDDDTDYAQALADSARTRAHVSTGLVLGGTVIAAIGGYLWYTAPKNPIKVTELGAVPTSGGGALVLSGRF